jgi:formylglycine-generating enzyme required for sulfatase activity
MKLKLISCLLLIASAVSALAADLGPVPLPPPPPTNTAKATDTNAPTEPPKTLPSEFTNSVDMILLKVSDMWVGKYDVTQKEYQKIMGYNPSAFSGPDNPVDSVSWNDAMAFCQKMTDEDIKEMKIPDGYYYTLPTEDEWESFASDTSLDDAVTSLGGNNRTGTAPVGSMKPNGAGLYDTRGNVAQWTLGDDSKPYRVLRGGSWQDNIDINLRPAFRIYMAPDKSQNTFGFRVVLKKK